MTESRERFIEMRREMYRHAVPKPSTARCKYCGKAYPVGEMGQIGLDVWICRSCV
jgi:ribosomal protein L37AE/L43A